MPFKKEYEVRSYFSSYYSKLVEADSLEEAAEKALGDEQGWELADYSWNDTGIGVADVEEDFDDNEYTYSE
jgi:hypothetical protein